MTLDIANVSRASLSPLRFLQRSAEVWRGRPAVADGERGWTYAEHLERVERVTGALRSRFGITDGDRVATLLPNVSAMLELHYAVPGAGGVLVPLNTRLAAPDYAFILEHSGARLLVAHRSFADVLDAAVRSCDAPPTIWWVDDDPASSDYDLQVASADRHRLELPDDEDALLSVNYTSGTTGRPKGVMTTHRGAYLHTLGVIAEARLEPASAYLWSLPMFHCNGWAYTWAVTAAGGRHVCVPEVSGAALWTGIDRYGATHLCAAPTVMTMLLGDPAAHPVPTPLRAFVGGAPPSPALIEHAHRLRIEMVHLYGLTETYGPLAVCAWNPDWNDLDEATKAELRARQGVGTVVSERLRVVDENLTDVPADASTLGEVVMRGNNVMTGYYRDPEATEQAFRGGWFHSGDLAVMHPDGYVELRDRLKDVVISGGENISTIEVEQALAAHPAVVETAVVSAPDERWGEVPVAFVVVGGEQPSADELMSFLRDRIAGFKIPRRFEYVGELPKTGTGKIQKFVLRQRTHPDS